MLKLLQLLILGHIHKWKILSQGVVTVYDVSFGSANGHRILLQCEVCGNVKKRDLI